MIQKKVCMVGVFATGKTSLVESLLWKAGAIGAPGSLERGTTVCDFDPLERRAQHSLNASVVHFGYREVRVHLIDTPGYAGGVRLDAVCVTGATARLVIEDRL